MWSTYSPQIYRPCTSRRLARWLVALLALLPLYAVPPGASTHPAPESPAAGQVTAPPAQAWSCWDPGDVQPCHDTLNDIAMLAPDDGWAVGENGAILHWDGSLWSLVSGPTDLPLRAVDMLSPTEGWVAGGTSGFMSTDAVMLHWDGSAWSEMPGPGPVYSLDMLSGTEGFAQSQACTQMVHTCYSRVSRWNGTGWTTIYDSPYFGGGPQRLAMVSGTDGWATMSGAGIWHWDGTAWTIWPDVPMANQANDIVALSASDVWTVGVNGEILHWDGSLWTAVSSPTTNSLYSVDFVSPADGWAAGVRGTLLHWDGNAWSAVSPVTGGTLDRVAMASGGAGWAVSRDSRMLLRWDGDTWRIVSDSLPGASLRDVVVLDSGEAWAVGGDAYPAPASVILHWDGNAWEPVASPTAYPLNAVTMLSPDDGWAVGGYVESAGGGNCYDHNVILHWDGWTWAAIPHPGDSPLYGVGFASATDGWAAGAGGTLLHWDGATWLAAASPATYDLYDVQFLDPADGWAAGEYEGPFHWDGSGWSTTATSSITTSLASLGVVSPTLVWAAGGRDWDAPVMHFGIVVAWDGNTWSQQLSVGHRLEGLSMRSASDGWVVGLGMAYHWDGSAWTGRSAPSRNCCEAVAIDASGEGWAVGGHALWRLTPGLFVNTVADAPDADPGDGRCAALLGACTLRAAVQEANAWPGPDSIVLPAGTYTLALPGTDEDLSATGDLDLLSDVDVRGAGAADTVIDGGRLDRVWDAHGTITVTISDLAVQGGANAAPSGAPGGGLRAGPGTRARLDTVVLRDNLAAGGGGLAALGAEVLMANSTVSGNSAEDGGGVLVAENAVLALTNSTLSGNTAQANGGGLRVLSATVTLHNVTVAANSAGLAGGGVAAGPASFGGANSLLAGNLDLDDGQSPDCSGTLVSLGYNLLQSASGCTLAGDPSGNQVGVDPLLGPLQLNGGSTATQALPGGSPAVDGGNPAGCVDTQGHLLTRDQRGLPRPAGLACDVGAFEFVQLDYRVWMPVAFGGSRWRAGATALK